MGARQKLNGAYVTGSIFVAWLVGIVADSWVAFLLALITLVGLNCYAGDIRAKGRPS